MLRKLVRKYFSTSPDPSLLKLLAPVPKEVEIDVSPGFLSMLFEQSKKSPSYLLLKQLFVYLQQSPLLGDQFPFIKSDERFEQNWMALHLQILKSRLLLEKRSSEAVNQLQLQRFNYNAQTYFFPHYAKYLHPHTPALNFAEHYAEAYLKRVQVFEEYFEENYEERPTEEKLIGLLRKLVYQNRVGLQDVELGKLARYYVAHRRYLGLLTWKDLLYNKVKWGFQEERKLLEELGK